MNKVIRNIPNTITCGNLLCGCLAIVKAFEGDLVWAAYLVGIACVFDFLDGFLARALKVSSPIGKDLDSLADLVTFGVVPGVVMYKLLRHGIYQYGENSFLLGNYPGYYDYLVYIAFLIPIFSAIRLAKFNNDVRQADSFIGLPTPANAILICSFPLVLKQQQDVFLKNNLLVDLNGYSRLFYLSQPNNLLLLVSFIIILSFLLIAPLPLFALKFKSFGWKGNEIRFVFLILAALLIGFLQFVGIPLVIVLYILMSVVHNLMRRPSK